tara:strand:- start:38 stop:1384 length:1347 start_codon:yes stop_codon:yes gene_type:complete
MAKNNKLSTIISKQYLLSYLLFTLITIICLSLFFYTNIQKSINDQAKAWELASSQNLLQHLIDSDYFSIERQVEMTKSSGLFSSFHVFDEKKELIYGFGKPDTKSSSHVDIVDLSGQKWGSYSFAIDKSIIYDSLGLIFLYCTVIALILISIFIFRMKKLINKNFSEFNRYLNSLSSGLNSISGDLDYKAFKSKLNTYNSELYEVNSISTAINRLISDIEKLYKRLNDYQSKAKLARTAAQISHDIKSPLTMFKVVSKDPQLSEDKKRLLLSGVERIEAISKQFLCEYKVASKKITNNDICESIYKIVKEKKHNGNFSSIEFLINLRMPTYTLKANIQIIEVVLSNIINNANEAMPEGGKICIHSSNSDNFYTITISDTGIGIEKEHKNIIKQEGFTTKKEGNGLGLNHADNYMTEIGGKLILKDNIPNGTQVVLQIPFNLNKLSDLN